MEHRCETKDCKGWVFNNSSSGGICEFCGKNDWNSVCDEPELQYASKNRRYMGDSEYDYDVEKEDE